MAVWFVVVVVNVVVVVALVFAVFVVCVVWQFGIRWRHWIDVSWTVEQREKIIFVRRKGVHFEGGRVRHRCAFLELQRLERFC